MPKLFRKLKGFTLLELLIVIAIIAILAAVVLLAINPMEILRKSRDTQRLSDLSTLRSAINLFITEKSGETGFSIGSSGTVYCQASGTDCTAVSTSRLVDGTGWIPINFASMIPSAPISVLPIDPSSGKTIRYATSGAPSWTWELDVELEADANAGMLTADGGFNDLRYEIGTNLTLLP